MGGSIRRLGTEIGAAATEELTGGGVMAPAFESWGNLGAQLAVSSLFQSVRQRTRVLFGLVSEFRNVEDAGP